MWPNDLTKKWGFSENPFSVSSAELEERFKDRNIDPQKFFLEPPYFGRIIGDPENAISTIIIGHRGDGKSFISNSMKKRLLDNHVCWDEIPGKDNGILIDFLEQRFGIEWAKTAKIEKSEDGKTFKATAERNSFSMKINDVESEALLEVNEIKIITLKADIENDKVNIHLDNHVCWDEIPGKDNGILIDFLEQKFGIEWAKTAKIEKSEDGKTFKATAERNSFSMKLNDEESEALLEVNEIKIVTLKAEIENDKVNIHLDNHVCWDEIPGTDNGILIDFLEQKFGINWAKTAMIEKSEDGKTLKATAERNSFLIKINDKKSEALLEVNEVKINTLKAEAENGKLRIYIDNKATKILVVDYIKFSDFDIQTLEGISLDFHLNKILKLSLTNFVEAIEGNPSLIEKLDSDKKNILGWFINKYTPKSYIDFDEFQNYLFDVQQEIQKVWRPKKAIFKFIKKCIRKIDHLRSKDVPHRKLEELENLDLFEQLVSLIKETGFASIYIIVDKLDEDNKLMHLNNIEKGRFISPLLTSLDFLQLKNVATKIFIPIEIKKILGTDIRSDRIDTINIKWDNRLLRKMLKKRLTVFSEGRIKSLDPYVEENVRDYFNNSILYYSVNNPRNLIHLINEIISELCENKENPELIDKLAIKNGIKKFLEIRRGQAEPDKYMDTLMTTHREYDGKELFEET